VLEFIGSDARSPEAVAASFPGFDVMRLVRASLVDLVLHEHADVVTHSHEPS
jgi:hypothetical protein